MANAEVLKEKVAKAQEKVAKCEGTIERHKKQLDKKIQAVVKAVGLDLTGKTKKEIEEIREPYRATEQSWLFFEVIGKLDDIKGAEKKLKDAEITLSNWQLKLDEAEMKDEFINNHIPQVIKDFLEEWRKLAFEWHVKKYEKFLVFRKELYAKEEQAIKDSYNLPYKERRKFFKEQEVDNIDKRLASFAGMIVLNMATYRNEEERLAYLDKVLREDVKAKALDLITRINAVVGTITDASGLKIDVKGCLNGIIEGIKASAKVETIGAGGWNIQCFHYRTLVNKLK